MNRNLDKNLIYIFGLILNNLCLFVINSLIHILINDFNLQHELIKLFDFG